MFRSALLVASLLVAAPAASSDIIGRATVVDGDTIDIHGARIRFDGIDAPESRQICLDAGGRKYRCGQMSAKGLVTEATSVTCYVLGSRVDPTETEDETKKGGRVVIRAMTYSAFVKRAEKRMLGLRDKLRDAPFLREQGLDAEAYMQPQLPEQGGLEFDTVA